MKDSKSEFVERAKEKLDLLDARIEVIEAKVNEKQGEARRELNDKLDDLRDTRIDIHRKLDELQNSGEAAWDDLKLGIERSWNALSKSVERAAERVQ